MKKYQINIRGHSRGDGRMSVKQSPLRRLKINVLICSIIILGFVAIGLFTTFSIQDSYTDSIRDISALSSQAMYTDILYMLEQPVNIASAMSKDTLLRDLMPQELEDGAFTDTVKAYLGEYQKTYGFDSVFLVSCQSRRYYHYANGIDRVLETGDPEDRWYFTFLEGSEDYSLNVDNDEAHGDKITIFVNCKVKGTDGRTLGVVGVGLETAYFQNLITEYEQKYGVGAYLIDSSGNVEVSSLPGEAGVRNLFEESEFSDMKGHLEAASSYDDEVWYTGEKSTGYRITRYIPRLNWYLVVEKNTHEMQQKMTNQLLLIILVAMIIILSMLAITTVILQRFNRSMLRLAEYDQLTGVRNRRCYELDIAGREQSLTAGARLGIGIFDLNGLKAINDAYGHQVGDMYIKEFARLLSRIFGEGAVYRIGGDEFTVILTDSDDAQVTMCWERLKKEMAAKDMGQDIPLGASFGYAFYNQENLNTMDAVFRAADEGMYQNKRRSQNETSMEDETGMEATERKNEFESNHP
ncbi:sensor domain-containing diguanylate cyclase [Eubacterium sp.]|uniref:sensor domain-containing diguanylate cyclase n=1 Tax=Eubacterium sp. TaxID=142586 RepID=UPI002FC908A1